MKNKTKDIAKKNKNELTQLLSEKRVALRNFRFSVSGSNVRNVKEGKALKKDIARIMTIINQLESKKAQVRKSE